MRAGACCPTGAQISEDAASGERGRRDACRPSDSRFPLEGGQSAVELALALPLLALLALGLLQVALVARDQVLLTHAAREAAREAAVAADPGAARRGALAGSRLDADRLTVTTDGRDGVGSRVTARLVYRSPTDVPVIGRLVPDVRLRATVTMRVEMSTLRVTKP